MKRNFLFIIFLSFVSNASAQKTYKDSIVAYQQNYMNTHGVVVNGDRKFILFYDIDESYRVIASFKRITDTTGFDINTSSGLKKKTFVYGLLTFKIHDSVLHLYVYQLAALMKKEDLKDYLFVPFG